MNHRTCRHIDDSPERQQRVRELQERYQRMGGWNAERPQRRERKVNRERVGQTVSEVSR